MEGKEHRFIEASRVYFGAPNDYGIYAISDIDADILIELESLLTKFDLRTIVNILESYKKDSDESVLYRLRAYNDKIPVDYGMRWRQKYITIGKDFTCNIEGLVSFEKIKKYDPKESSNKYYILVNKNTIKKDIPFADTLIEFYSEKERDAEFERVKKTLQELSNIIFL